MQDRSPLHRARYSYKPKLPEVLKGDIGSITVALDHPTESVADRERIHELFPLTYGAPTARFMKGENPEATEKRRVGVVLSGGQAPGGHNVIAGLFDALKRANPSSTLFGFKNGPRGIFNDDVMELKSDLVDAYRNTGGFSIIGSGRDKLETEEQFKKGLETCRRHDISAVVIVGGDDSNTNGAVLAEWFKKKKSGITVVGCPKTIDGDLKNEHIEISFGFDTATKTYSELVGNIARDAESARKYWHFIKLMGRSASHIALECALKTHPSMCIISEEVKSKGMSLDQVVDSICQVVSRRAAAGMDYGVLLIPEGLIEFIPEMAFLIGELNDLLAGEARYFDSIDSKEGRMEWVNRGLSKDASYVFSSLPRLIRSQLLDDRDPHGNVQVSRIETEKLLMEMVEEKLVRMKQKGEYGGRFSALTHFFGYGGRAAFPSNFDADYCYSLGYSSFLLITRGLTGYIANLRELHREPGQWMPGGMPLTMMMNIEQRHGKRKPVIRKALVELDGAPFKFFAAHRDLWAMENHFNFPGAIQYYGPAEICDQPPLILKLEKGDG